MGERWIARAAIVAFAVAHLAAGVVGVGLALPGDGLPAIWPAAGLAVAVLVRADRAWWPGLLAAIAIGDAVAARHDDRSVAVALGVALAAVVEAAVVAALVRRWTVDGRIDAPGDLVQRFVAPAVVGCALGGAIGAGVLAAGTDAELLVVFRRLFAADLVGILVVAPIVLVAPWRPTRARDLAALWLPAVVVGATVAAFALADDGAAGLTGTRLAVAGLVLVAARAPLQVTAATAAAVASTAVWMTAHGYGPFVGEAVVQADLDAAQTIVAVLVLGSLALGTSVELARRSDARLRSLVDHLPHGAVVLERRGSGRGALAPTYANAAMLDLFAVPDVRALDTAMTTATGDDAPPATTWSGAVVAGHTVEADHRIRTADGIERWVAETAVPLFDDAGRVWGVVGSALDVSERKRHEADLARRALHDGLTGLPNRQHFEDRVRAALADLDGRRSLAVLFVDLDGFKAVNDTLGHDAGDLVLCEVATRLADAVREPDVVARLGGDEFALLCVGDVDASTARRVAQRLRRRVAQPLVVGGVEVVVGVSIGVATTRDPGAQLGALLRAADQAMYGTKRAGVAAAR
jgi:diguanylate cyclase (GGDEF)-like protein